MQTSPPRDKPHSGLRLCPSIGRRKGVAVVPHFGSENRPFLSQDCCSIISNQLWHKHIYSFYYYQQHHSLDLPCNTHTDNDSFLLIAVISKYSACWLVICSPLFNRVWGEICDVMPRFCHARAQRGWRVCLQ